MSRPRLSVIVIAYNMAREIPRTLRSLSPSMQRGLTREDYEIILVDNGSREPAPQADWGSALRTYRVENPTPSPVPAINAGLRMARGDLIGVLIDGARLASPGLLHGALRAARLHDRPVIGTLGFHLGPDVQMRSVLAGYNQAQEDRLLASVAWEEDGYRLFNISVLAGSSANGWFMPINESNALFLPRSLWEELGGYDERFVTPGGGLVNLDTYARSCQLPNSQLIVLLSEGTFHQVHGGIATNTANAPFAAFHEEYIRLRGGPFRTPNVEPLYIGKVVPQVLPFIEASAQTAMHHRNR